jgi:hypothetical protein
MSGHADTIREFQSLDEVAAEMQRLVVENQRLRDALEAAGSFIESILIGDEYGNPASPLNVAARRELAAARAALAGTSSEDT